jgi:hypothetical protein
MWYSKELNILETGSASQMLCSLDYQMMDSIQKPINPECYTPSSETFKI